MNSNTSNRKSKLSSSRRRKSKRRESSRQALVDTEPMINNKQNDSNADSNRVSLDSGQNKRAKVDSSATKVNGAPSHEKSTPKVDNLSNNPSSLASNDTGIQLQTSTTNIGTNRSGGDINNSITSSRNKLSKKLSATFNNRARRVSSSIIGNTAKKNLHNVRKELTVSSSSHCTGAGVDNEDKSVAKELFKNELTHNVSAPCSNNVDESNKSLHPDDEFDDDIADEDYMKVNIPSNRVSTNNSVTNEFDNNDEEMMANLDAFDALSKSNNSSSEGDMKQPSNIDTANGKDGIINAAASSSNGKCNDVTSSTDISGVESVVPSPPQGGALVATSFSNGISTNVPKAEESAVPSSAAPTLTQVLQEDNDDEIAELDLAAAVSSAKKQQPPPPSTNHEKKNSSSSIDNDSNLQQITDKNITRTNENEKALIQSTNHTNSEENGSIDTATPFNTNNAGIQEVCDENGASNELDNKSSLPPDNKISNEINLMPSNSDKQETEAACTTSTPTETKEEKRNNEPMAKAVVEKKGEKENNEPVSKADEMFYPDDATSNSKQPSIKSEQQPTKQISLTQLGCLKPAEEVKSINKSFAAVKREKAKPPSPAELKPSSSITSKKVKSSGPNLKKSVDQPTLTQADYLIEEKTANTTKQQVCVKSKDGIGFQSVTITKDLKDQTYSTGDIWYSESDQGVAYMLGSIDTEGTVYKAEIAKMYIRLEKTYIGAEQAANVVEKNPNLAWVMVEEHPLIPNDRKIQLKSLCKKMNENEKPTTTLYYKEDSPTYAYYNKYDNNQFTPPLQNCEKPAVLDLFAGCGGMSTGLHNSGWTVKYELEKNQSCVDTLRRNKKKKTKKIFSKDISQFLREIESGAITLEDITYIHASPPCQGFSLVNTSGGNNDWQNKQCTIDFLKVVQHVQPPFVSMENVPGMAAEKKGGDSKKYNKEYLQFVMSSLLSLGYNVSFTMAVASSYGDPQDRKRIILFASKGYKLPSMIAPTHGNGEGLEPIITVQDVLQDLEDVDPNCPGRIKLNGKTVQGHFVEGTAQVLNSKDDDMRLYADHPARTVKKDVKILHYKLSRYLTILEKKRLMSFPDSLELCGSKKDMKDQIGNSVPCCLAKAIGQSVMESYLLGAVSSISE